MRRLSWTDQLSLVKTNKQILRTVQFTMPWAYVRLIAKTRLVGRDKVSTRLLLQDMPHHTLVTTREVKMRTPTCLLFASKLLPEAWFQCGGITLLDHTERVWEHEYQTQSATTRIKCLRARYMHKSPLILLQSLLPFCRFSVNRFDTTVRRFLQPSAFLPAESGVSWRYPMFFAGTTNHRKYRHTD